MDKFTMKLRSNRKRRKMAVSQDVEISPGSNKKSKDSPPTLLTLPFDIQSMLFKYLDIKSLEALAKTCCFYDQMIHGRYITTMTLPFRGDFLKNLKDAEVIEKKPILRLECKEGESYIELQAKGNLKKYVVESQLSLLSLNQVREIDIQPREIPGHSSIVAEEIKGWNKTEMEMTLLTELSSLGVMRNISRLHLLLVSVEMGKLLWKKIIPQMKNLLELGITVVESKAV